jgi:hypothetical protein
MARALELAYGLFTGLDFAALRAILPEALGHLDSV